MTNLFDTRWPAPTDFVGASLFDELVWNTAQPGNGAPPIAPTLDLPGTVVDQEGEPYTPSSAAAVELIGTGAWWTQAAVYWPAASASYVLPAGSGPAWRIDGLEPGREYAFACEAQTYDVDHMPHPRVRLEVLGTEHATSYGDASGSAVPFELVFVATATEHYVALTTETDWETWESPLPQPGRQQITIMNLSFETQELPTAPVQVAFTAPTPTLRLVVSDENVWDDPEPEDPEEGGDIEPPEPPDPRDLPASVPDETYIGFLDEDGNEITGPGYERVPAPGWEFDDDTSTITNPTTITSPTPGGQWPVVVSMGVFTTPAGGRLVTSWPLPVPIGPGPGAPIAVPPRAVDAVVRNDPRLRRYSEIMAAPVLDEHGFPVDWEPHHVVDEIFGRVQVIVEGVDISQLLGAPLPVPSWTRAEPFGSVSATIPIPQITAFHNLNSFGWCKKGANVDIRLIRKGQSNVRRFSGYISTFGHSEDTGVFTLECIGALYQADQQLRLPATDIRPKDIGTVIRQTLNQVVGRRYKKVPKRTIGAKTSVLGAWEPRLTGYVQQLLATTVDKKGRQWTVECPVRNPRIVRKNTTAVTWHVTNGQRGIRVDLQSDDTPNVLYGEGVREDGGRWRNMKYPNWRTDDTPPFPNWNPIRSIGVGTRDQDTDSGDGVSVWQDKVGQKVTGTFSQDDRRVLQERQRAAGILVDGWLGPQSWAAEFATGSNTGSLDGAFPMPLAYSQRVMPRLYGGDGEDLGPNPRYNPNAIRVEEKIDFGQGVTLKEGRRAAKAQLQRDSGRGWAGQIGFTLDPEEISRFDITEGTNGRIRHFRGQDLQVHVARVDYGPDEVVAYVDTKARDYPTLAAILERERNATDPAKALIKRQTAAKLGSDRAEWDAEAPGGRIPRHAVFGGLWTVLRIPVAAYGSIVRTQYRATGPAAAFALGVFDRPITAARLNTLIGNPLSGDSNAWDDNADELEDLGLLMAWGWAKQPCGYYPGSYATPDGDNQSPLTGRMVDDASWEFASTRPPWLWVAEIADRNTQLSGRFFPGV